jgi:hypothetical protein
VRGGGRKRKYLNQYKVYILRNNLLPGEKYRQCHLGEKYEKGEEKRYKCEGKGERQKIKGELK